ncbi:MFS transporter (plasmid) [Rhizobium ruizarguesonis]|nr:MFS transporter [Rhizobium ruizarguesonis]
MDWNRHVRSARCWGSSRECAFRLTGICGYCRGNHLSAAYYGGDGRAPSTRGRTVDSCCVPGQRDQSGVASGAWLSIGKPWIRKHPNVLDAAVCRQGWQNGWIGVTSFATALVVGRVGLGHVPDRFGGPTTALVFALVEASGLLTMGLASHPGIALIGAGLVGFGYSLVFPGFGIAVVRAAPPENRGMAMGLYSACLDVALALSGPLLGLVGDAAGIPTIFLASGAIVSLSALVALSIMRRSRATA